MSKLARHKRPETAFLFLDLINNLTQHRRAFFADDTRALADNICRFGLLDPLIVVRFTRDLAQEYVDLINQFYKTDHRLSEMRSDPCGNFLIVLSGERRLRAHWLVWESGCSSCRETYGQEEPGKCWQRHFGLRKVGERWVGKTIESRVYTDLSAIEAIDIQLSGNSYVPPKEQEMIETYSLQFFIKKKMNPKLTVAEFARSVGKAPDTMRGYFRVISLPEAIYGYYQQGFISLGIAQELAFLKDQGENDLEFWAMRAIISKMKVDVFHQKVREHLRKRTQTILEIFEEGSSEEMKKLFVRKTVAKEMVADLHTGNLYWRQVLRLFEEGKLGRRDSPFSEGSPVRLYRKNIDLIRDKVLPHLAQFFPKEALAEIEETLRRVDLTAAKLEEGQTVLAAQNA